MDIDEFAAWAAAAARVETDGGPYRERLSYLGLGLAGEAGEVVEHIKKLLRDGEDSWNPDAVADELGDLAYYWAALCVAVGRSPGAVLAASREKIDGRLQAVQADNA